MKGRSPKAIQMGEAISGQADVNPSLQESQVRFKTLELADEICQQPAAFVAYPLPLRRKVNLRQDIGLVPTEGIDHKSLEIAIILKDMPLRIPSIAVIQRIPA
jgi:hypothetical protein